MKEYVGFKSILATSMTRKQYNAYRGWDVPSDEDGSDEGYLVEYVNGGTSNHPNHAGYISWSPKEVFEQAYHEKQDKVEASHIDSLVQSLEFKFARIEDTTTTVCEAFLPNGFSVGSGKSACVNPANFDYELGCKYAQENALSDARETLWQLEGYLLKVTGKTSDKF